MIAHVMPWGTIQVPRYPDGQRAVVEELPACAGQATCTYQATAVGAMVAQATLANGRVLAARNTGKSGARVQITADETTLTYGDTTVFRVSTSDASPFEVTGYEYQPVALGQGDMRVAVDGRALLRVTESASRAHELSPAVTATEDARPTRVGRPAYFRDADVECASVIVDMKCYFSPEVTGYGVVNAVVDGVAQRDSVLMTVMPLLVIERAGGPNEGGSFLTAIIERERPENVIGLRARVAPASLAPNVEWEVLPLDSLVGTVIPDSILRGATSSFAVPAGRNRSPNGFHRVVGPSGDTITDPGRWPRAHPATPTAKQAQLARKALGYRVTAKVTVGGVTVRSATVSIQQDEKDVMREEYVDFGWSLDSIPPRDSMSTRGPPERNLTGDYQYWMTGARLEQKMPVMLQLSRDQLRFTPVIISGYRNPVHHFVHAKARATRSQHLTGNATDWKIDETSRPQEFTLDEWFTELFKLTRDPTVDGCWEPAHAIRAGSRDGRTLDHAHSDWRRMTLRECPATWRRRD